MSESSGATRRRVLECMAWGGAGLVWTMRAGVPVASIIGEASAATKGFSFAQISDTHIGFSKPANPDPAATLREAIGKIAALPQKPAFLIHTGDITQLAKPKEFDDFDELIKEARLDVHYTPGEHDVLDERPGSTYLARYGKGARGGGWRSFDQGGVHFVCLVNVLDLRPGGMGALGPEQIAWLREDLAGKSASTPIVVYTHIPLWTVSAEWGWGTQDSAEALEHLARFGSVTVLNGHVHQILQKVEGHVAFHTARSTAFPQPAPGAAPAPGPKLVPAGELRAALGVRQVTLARGAHPLAVADHALAM